MKQKLFIMAAALMASVAATAAQLTVNVQTAGTLEAVINAQSVTNITDLTITGKLGAPDIAYLRQCEGRIASLCTLNMRGATLVPSDEPYLIDNGFAFFISNEEKFVPAKSDPNATPVSYRGMFARSRATGPFFAKAAEGEFDPDKYNCYYGKGLPGAFQWSPLEKIIMPSDVKKVGMWAFANSNLLETVEVPGGLTTIADKAFKGNVSLTNINLSGVTEIGTEAFSGCTGLTEVNLNSLQTIGESAFAGCSGIMGIMELPKLKKLSFLAFLDCTGITSVILSGTEVISDLAFYRCSNLEKATFSNNLDSIGRKAFCGTKLQTLTFPASLSYIGGGAFYNVPLESVTFTKSKKSLTIANPKGDIMFREWSDTYYDTYDSSGAFERTKLKEVVMPEGLVEIGDRAFEECVNMVSVTLPSTLKRIGVMEKDFSGSYTDGAFNRTKIKSITLPESLEMIGAGTFGDCYSLGRITIPNSVKEIGEKAFYGCSNLATVTIPSSLEYIGPYAFTGTKWAKEQKAGSDGVLYYGPIAIRMTLSSVSDGTTIKIKEGTISIDPGFIYEEETTVGNNVTLELPSTLKNINRWAFGGDDISKVVFKEGLTRIGESAFSECTKLKSADLPSSLKYIGKRAFYGCTSLTKITIPENVEVIGSGYYDSYGVFNSTTAFEGSGIAQLTIRARHLDKERCHFGKLPSLTRIVVGSEVEVLPAGLVSGSADLLRIIFEDRAESSRLFVGRQCFPYSNLSSLTLPNCQLEIDEYAFTVGGYYSYPSTTEVEVLGTVVAMAPYAFSSYDTWSGLKSSIRLGGGIKEIPLDAFRHCTGLTSISIPNSVTSIGEGAFSYCTGLTSISIPNSVTSIGSNAFNQSGLTSITLPNSITTIESGTFSYCKGLTSFIIPNSVTTIGDAVFYLCDALTSVTIGKSVKFIDGKAFYGCSGLTEVHIPDLAAWCKTIYDEKYGVNNPLNYAHHLYLNGKEVTDLVIPNDVDSIGSYAFQGGSSITSVTFPSSVKAIGKGAFSGCSSIEEVRSMIREPFAISDVFDRQRYANATLYVPRGTKSKYEATDGWKEFRKIVEMDDQPQGDVNFDNTVDVADIASVISAMAGSAGVSPAQADVNGDGVVDVADIATIISIMAGK